MNSARPFALLVVPACLAIAPMARSECRPYVFGMGHFLASWAGQPWSYDAQAMDRMVEMGATAVWVDFPWAGMEQVQGAIDWSYADHQVTTAEARGLQIFAFVGTTPDWAKLYPGLPSHRTPPSEAHLAAFQAFHTAVAARYAGRVTYYQFWNEPSGCGWINDGCSNGSDCSLFTTWQKRAYESLKAGNPDCIVSAGGFDGDPAGYVQCMYTQLAGQRGFDAISIHPYALGGSGGRGTSGEGIDYSDLTEVRQVMVNNGDAGKAIWITEYGWNTTNQTRKAEDLAEVLTELKKPEFSYLLFVKYLVLNDWDNHNGNPGDDFCCYGLTDEYLNPYSPFYTFKNFDKTFADSVDFAANVVSGIVPLTVQFTDFSCVAGASAWHWDFGDGQTGSVPDPSHTYLGAGTYTVRLTVTGSGGPLTMQKTNLITVMPGSVDFSADVTAGPSPLSVHFTDHSTVGGISAWLWDFGDGQTSTLQNPDHTYTVEGSFKVRLTVTAGGVPQMAEKPGFVRVGSFPKAAFIGGVLPPTTADSQIIDRLRSLGLLVDVYDDEPANRPTAPQIAATHDVVLVSSTVLSANVAGEFRYQSVPFIYWESSLGWITREATAEGQGIEGNSTQIAVVDNTHPITAGLPIGSLTVTTGGEDFSRCTGPIAPGARVLATKVGDASRRMILVVEPGAQLLDGGAAAGKRVLLYLYDTTWQKTNATGKKILDNAVAYAVGSPAADFAADRTLGVVPMAVQFSDQSTGPVTSWNWDFGDGTTSTLRHPSHTFAQPGTFTVSLVVTGPGPTDTRVRTDYVIAVEPNPFDSDSDGDVDVDDLAAFESCASGPGVAPAGSHCGSADRDADQDVDQSDFAAFQRCFSGSGVAVEDGCL